MHERVDTIVLDTTNTSADLDPWRLCVELRHATNAMLIALTRAGQNRDRVRAFRAGASQCLTVPVSPPELAACLESVPRPRRAFVPDQGIKGVAPYADAGLQIDVLRRLIRRDGRAFPLPPREAVVMNCLLKNIGRIVRKEELCEAVWSGAATPAAELRLKIYIANLRRKIERDPKRPCYIISQRGHGYGFIPQPDTQRLPDTSEAVHQPAAAELETICPGNYDDASFERAG
jgi:DNA-binding response OmpR family regulator